MNLPDDLRGRQGDDYPVQVPVPLDLRQGEPEIDAVDPGEMQDLAVVAVFYKHRAGKPTALAVG